MVAYDPKEATICKLGAGGAPGRYHVLFFGDVPQRAWVPAGSLRLWSGDAEHAEFREGQVHDWVSVNPLAAHRSFFVCARKPAQKKMHLTPPPGPGHPEAAGEGLGAGLSTRARLHSPSPSSFMRRIAIVARVSVRNDRRPSCRRCASPTRPGSSRTTRCVSRAGI